MNVETTREGSCDSGESYLKYANATPTLLSKPCLVVMCSSTMDLCQDVNTVVNLKATLAYAKTDFPMPADTRVNAV